VDDVGVIGSDNLQFGRPLKWLAQIQSFDCIAGKNGRSHIRRNGHILYRSQRFCGEILATTGVEWRIRAEQDSLAAEKLQRNFENLGFVPKGSRIAVKLLEVV